MNDDDFLNEQNKIRSNLAKIKDQPPQQSLLKFRPVPRKQSSAHHQNAGLKPPLTVRKYSKVRAAKPAASPAAQTKEVAAAVPKEKKMVTKDHPANPIVDSAACPSCQHINNSSPPTERELICSRCSRVTSWEAVRRALSHEHERCKL